MISSFNWISRREEINELFEQLGQVLVQRVEALLIGGAVMLELGLKDATKDIDVVCRSEEDKERLLASARALGFQIVGPEKRHDRPGVNRLAVKGGRNLDIFVMKLIANRPGDAPDCSNLVIAGLDFDAVYREIEAQYRKAGEVEQKIWITYIEEGIARLEDNDLTIPIGMALKDLPEL